MNKVDIVLVKPGSQMQIYGELSLYKLTAIEPPLWAALLAAYLRKLGYSVVLYDAEVENWSYEETAEKIKETDPLLASVMVSGSNPTASTMNMTGAGKIISLIKKLSPHIRIMLAGLHPSALPERTITEEDADFVCQGEGFFTVPKLIEALKAGLDNFPIEGLWYKKNGRVASNPRPPLMKDLDELPMPAWDLLPIQKYRAHNWHCFDDIENRQPYAVVYTSLGCPFKCSFCCINTLFGKPGIRYRSPEFVMREIDYLVNTYNVRNIKIIDEMFALKRSHVHNLCNMIIERGYDLNMWVYARVDTVDQKMLSRMKQAGINWVAYGFESGNKQVLDEVNKGYSLEEVEKVVQMTRKEGQYICANFIFGLPGDDYDSAQDTLNMAIDMNAEWANLYSAMAYPGSKLYEIAIENGWQLPETWQGFSQYAYETLPLPTKYLSGGQVLAFRDRSFNVYFTNPRYLTMISRKFGDTTAGHIRQMCSRKLKRWYDKIN